MQQILASFEDVDELSSTVEAWDAELIPLASIARGVSAGTLIQCVDVGYQYMFATFPVGMTMCGAPPKGLITFNIQEATRRHYWWRGHDLDASMAWVFPLDGELGSISAPDFRVHTLSVTEERVAAVAAGLEIDLPPESKRPEVFPVPDDVLQHIRACLNAMRDLSSPFPIDYVGEILSLLIPLWLRREASSRPIRPSVRARYRAVRKSLEFIEASDPQEVTPQELLDLCHVSERTLQYAFRECFATTPAAFIKSLRLARARAALRAADPTREGVGDIATSFGFWHLPQFAQDYRKKFGELPSETLAR